MPRLSTAALAALLALSAPAAANAAPAGPSGKGVFVLDAQPGADVRELVRSRGGSVDRRLAHIDAWRVNLPTAAAAALSRHPLVESVEADVVVEAAWTPNDPLLSQQWSIPLTRTDSAWDTTRGASSVKVAVLDTGVSRVGDLAPAVLPGYDFVNEDSDAVDDNGHGTYAASVIAARADDGAGIAGVCPECTILPGKVLDAAGSGYMSDIADGIVWATDSGAQVVNLSLSGPSDTTYLASAVDYATSRGVLLLAAAGNDGLTTQRWPAADPDVVAVAGSDKADAKYSWSNHDPSWVDVAAPGCNVAGKLDGTYAWFCGTSSATPYAAGVAALRLASHPGEKGPQLRASLEATAKPVSYVAHGRVDAAAAVQYQAAALLSPSAGTVIGASATLSADAPGAAGVEFLLDGTVVAKDEASPFSVTWSPTGIAAGEHSLSVRAVTSGGALLGESAGVKVVVDAATPSGQVATQAGTILSGSVKTGVRASDDIGVARVDLFAGSTWLGYTTSGADGTWTVAWSTSKLAAGEHYLQAKVRDTAGRVSYSRRVQVLVDNAAPSGAVDVAAGSTFTGTATTPVAAADDLEVVRVDLFAGKTWVGYVLSPAADGRWVVTWNTSRVGAGTHLLQAKVTDVAGKVAYSKQVSVVVL